MVSVFLTSVSLPGDETRDTEEKELWSILSRGTGTRR